MALLVVRLPGTAALEPVLMRYIFSGKYPGISGRLVSITKCISYTNGVPEGRQDISSYAISTQSNFG